MDKIVSNKFDLKRRKIMNTLYEEIDQIKREYNVKGMFHSGPCVNAVYKRLKMSAEQIVDALLGSYKEVQDETEEDIFVTKATEIDKEIRGLANREHNRVFSGIKKFGEQSRLEIPSTHNELYNESVKKTEVLLETAQRRKKPMAEQKRTFCGPLAKSQCDQNEDTKKHFFAKNVFLDIPYSNYDDCEEVLRTLLKELELNAIVAKDKLTSNAVLCKVCALIKTCKYGITDISTASNSVSYEYGLMHGLGMKVCLAIREEKKKFTDIAGLEHVPYEGLRSFKIAIAKWILDNVEEVDKRKVKGFIESEETLLKTKDIPLIERKLRTRKTSNRKKPKLCLWYNILRGSTIGVNPIREYGCRIVIGIKNVGRGIAKYPKLSLKIKPPYRISEYELDGNLRSGLPKITTGDYQNPFTSYAGGVDAVIHPQGILEITSITFNIKSQDRTIPDVVINSVMNAEDIKEIKEETIIKSSEIINAIIKDNK